MSFEWAFLPDLLSTSGSPYYGKDQGYDRNNKQNMNESACTVNKKAQDPSNDQNNRDNVQ